jgi:hypothetical protein
MEFSKESLNELINQISLNKELTNVEIPCVDLYMDQITTLFEDKLSHLKRDKTETILTKTMINNYAKNKILTPIKNKKYNKTQIMLLILIYNLKQVLSLEDIKLLLTPIINNLSSSSSSEELFNGLYDNFLSIKKTQSANFPEDILAIVSNIEDMYTGKGELNSDSKMILTVLTLIASASLQKRMAEKIIDTYFKNGI